MMKYIEIYTHKHTKPSNEWTCEGDDGEEEDEAKMGFIFKINEHVYATQLHEEKGQKRRDLTTYTILYVH